VKHVPPERVKCPHCVYQIYLETNPTSKHRCPMELFLVWSLCRSGISVGEFYYPNQSLSSVLWSGICLCIVEDFVLVDLPHSLTNGTEYLLQYFGHEYEGYPQAGDLLVKFEHQLLASHSLQLHNTFDVLYTHTIQHLSQLIPSSSSSSSSSNSDCKLSFKCLPWPP